MAVDRAFTPEIQHTAATAFDTRSGDLVRLGAFENYVFRFERDGHARILRIGHSTHRSANEVRAEVDWLDHLRSEGLEVCAALPSASGERVVEIEDGRHAFVVSCFEFAPGTRPTSGDLAPELFERWGAFIGRSHRATRSYRPRPAAPRRKRWNEDPYFVNAFDLVPVSEARARERIVEIIAAFGELPEPDDAFGLCHTDLHPDNFHIDDGRIVAFDADDCAYHWFLEDISSALYYGYQGASLDEAYVHRFLPAFWRGYRRHYDLDAGWLEHLPLFLTGRAMTLYILVHLKWNRDRMSDRHYAWIDRHRAYLVEGAPWDALDFRRIAAG